MRTKLRFLFFLLTLTASVQQVAAQNTQLFRISGPAASKIIGLRADGTLVWSNAQPGGTFVIQSASLTGGATNWANYLQVTNANAVTTNIIPAINPNNGMVLIPAGSFTIGDTLDGESDAIPTNVMVSAFYMDVNLIPASQWYSVGVYATFHGYGFIHPGQTRYPNINNYPVDLVDWYDCVKWCNARSQMTGLAPVYFMDSALTQIYTNGEPGVVYVNWTNNGYRLPTEAEWEKAARGGLSGQRFPWGNTIDWGMANYYGDPAVLGGLPYDNSTSQFFNPDFNDGTSPVGFFAPNGYGLYDMAGNVMEWCWDWYAAPPYPTGSPYLGGTDPHGPASGSFHMLRGGCYIEYASDARCANRINYPLNPDTYIGFRCVRTH